MELPAVNTPQFRWVKSRLPNKAQPVPPIFQPELIAEGIAWAADHPQASRELIIGWPALKAILGNKLVPTYADRVLARDGYAAQQTDDLEDPTPAPQPVGSGRRSERRGPQGARCIRPSRVRFELAAVGKHPSPPNGARRRSSGRAPRRHSRGTPPIVCT